MPRGFARVPLLVLLAMGGCARERPLPSPETFDWGPQPITFSPPPDSWRREGENGGGMLGVRFVLTGGGGQCISVVTYRRFAERDRRDALERLIARRDSLDQREFLRELSLARARTDDPLSEREASAARTINEALDRASSDELSGSPGFAVADLHMALKAAQAYQPTLTELLPHIRLRPERMQEPERWKIANERDTTIAGFPAFASDDTLFTPERPLLYREVFWVVRGQAFKATFQGVDEQWPVFVALLGTLRFPEGDDAPAK